MIRSGLLGLALALASQDGDRFIAGEGAWDYKVTTGEEGAVDLARPGGWVAAADLRGIYSQEKPESARLWVVGSYHTPFLVVDSLKSRMDLYRVCRGPCGKPGLQPFEHYVLTDQIELPLEKGKKWKGKRHFEGCTTRDVEIRYEVLDKEKVGDRECWKIRGLIDDEELRRHSPDFDWEERLWLAPGVGIVKAHRKHRPLSLDCVGYRP